MSSGWKSKVNDVQMMFLSVFGGSGLLTVEMRVEAWKVDWAFPLCCELSVRFLVCRFLGGKAEG